jgi:hypothetical protein
VLIALDLLHPGQVRYVSPSHAVSIPILTSLVLQNRRPFNYSPRLSGRANYVLVLGRWRLGRPPKLPSRSRSRPRRSWSKLGRNRKLGRGWRCWRRRRSGLHDVRSEQDDVVERIDGRRNGSVAPSSRYLVILCDFRGSLPFVNSNYLPVSHVPWRSRSFQRSRTPQSCHLLSRIPISVAASACLFRRP